ncbi:MAG: hypothetical protein IBV52_01555 [Candidatus Bathyarchaeota archaeon]
MADLALKKQTQEGLFKLFNLLSCKGVAKEIKAGRNVTGNVEFGIRMCVHDRFGPRVDVKTMKFYPQTAKSKKIEKKFVNTTNKLLEIGGFRKISPKFLAKLKQKDKAFEQKIKKRRAERKK